MTQKDKVKELVGRGLHSYHTKSLQQMDRIEKKNKEQNHKISILSNELDNDYLTKTEEGSVVSLEHSKEGMVYLDELQGNTLVNYCTDGSKEMTLNGDIDVEGTFVTTTEGVDNGKVDIMCEGNTLVNLVKGGKAEKSFAYDGNSTNVIYPLIKKGVLNQQYTLICKLTNPNSIRLQISIDEGWTVCGSTNLNGFLKINVLPTTIEEPKNGKLMIYIIGEQNGLKISDCMLLEGDWTNKEVPPYFEGMKSVGECEDNKIEILSQNKNLFRKELVQQGNLSGGLSDLGIEITHPSQYKRTDFIKIKPNTTYSVSMNGDIFKLEKKMLYDENKKCISNMSSNTFNSGSAKYLRVVFAKLVNTEVETDEVLMNHNIQIEEGNVRTDYEIGVLNKKEISLNEPLRGLPNGTKDKIIKIGNKPFIERNVGKHILNGSEYWSIYTGDWVLDNSIVFSTTFPNAKGYVWKTYKGTESMSDKIPSYADDVLRTTDVLGYTNDNTGGAKRFRLPKSYLSSEDVEGCKQWFSNNNVEVIYELATPTYEPLELEPVLNTYNDVTHISNNSIIPCNMKIQNTGYNAIIKPNTLYTVALDTNKSGTIGMNLGGAKGTTTNNVATITTPATLADDSLRIYGKGIKGSKVRILEGDKTNWMPSHFEGMKSSFEDKFDATDNTYKMEILSKNKNLFNVNDLVAHSQNLVYFEIINDNSFKIKSWANRLYKDVSKILKPNTKYIIKCKATVVEKNNDANLFEYNVGFNLYNFTMQRSAGAIIDRSFTTLNYSKEINWTFTTPSNLNDFSLLFYTNRYVEDGVAKLDTILVENLIITEHNSEYEQGLLNKIQFSSIEPLRSVEDVKDRFVFKDNKLMIERNIGQYLVNGNESWFVSGDDIYFSLKNLVNNFAKNQRTCITSKYPNFNQPSTLVRGYAWWGGGVQNANGNLVVKPQIGINTIEEYKSWVRSNNYYVTYIKEEPDYEEIPHELQKIILEGYENGTLFFDTNIPPTSTVTYAGETPIVKSVKLNKTEVLNNTEDINDNIIPYLMDMDYRVVCLQLATEEIEGGVSMARLFGGTYEMIKRDILSKRLSRQEYGYRLADYFNAGKLTEQEVRELEDLR